MGLYAIIKDEVVDSIAVSDSPLETDGIWICLDGLDPMPSNGWSYKDGVFSKNIVPFYVKNTTIKHVLNNHWSNIEQTAQSDSDVMSWVNKVNESEQLEYCEQYDKELLMLKSKNLISDSEIMKLQPWQIFYVSM